MSEQNINVVYIAGGGRSGSTLLDRILGSAKGVTSVNELRWTWQGNSFEDHVCSCGKHALQCEFWGRVLSEMKISVDEMNDFVELQKSVETYKMFLPILFGFYTQSFRTKLQRYRVTLALLYRSIAKVSGNKTIVDSTKTPPRALILQGIPGINVSVVHLVRNAVPVIHSWQKKNYKAEHGAQFKDKSFIVAIALWILANIYAEFLRSRLPYRRVRYEDLCEKPQLALRELCSRVDMLADHVPEFVGKCSIELHQIHSLSGNPGRFVSGITEIRPEEKWKQEVPFLKSLAIKFLTWPLLLRYGYL